MASRNSRFRLQLLTIMARRAKANIESFIPARRWGRLRDSIRYIVTEDGITIYSLYYWARFVNDGRRGVEAAPGKVLVFFADPQDDPRIAGDYPRKLNQLQRLRLSREEFRQKRKSGELIVTKAVGPAGGMEFLQQGLRKTRNETKGVFREMIRGEIRKLIRRGTNKITARFG